MLKKKGKLNLLVPAKKFAYTKLDKELGHHRRYEKQEIISKLTKSGYHITIFNSIVSLLRKIESVIPVPLGISLIVVARKT
jgi:hypothetical protein